MSIRLKIEQYKLDVIDRWHTPGHKGLLWEDDISEIDDGCCFPSDSIKIAEENAALFYGAKHLRFLTGGSSMGVKAGVIASDGDIIAFENAHQSVFEAALLNKVKAHTVSLKRENGLFCQPTLEDIERACIQYKDARAVCITSPDYYGRVIAKEAVDLVHSYNKLLLADSAHGAHFPLSCDLLDYSFANCADFCNLSAHKTMFAMTMGAYLCVNNDAYLKAINEALKNLGTTSPLYPLLASLEAGLVIGQMNKSNYDYIRTCVLELSENVPLLKNDDFTRIVVDCYSFVNRTGKELYEILYKEHQIAAEMYYGNFLVFIATHADDESKFYRLRAALMDIKKRWGVN